MGAGEILKAIWEGYKAGSSGKDLFEFSTSIAGLEVAAAQIEQNQTSYINNKSESNVRNVKANITRIRTYLRNFDTKPPSFSEMKDLEEMTNYQVSTAIGNRATQLLFDIDMAINSGSLPEIDERPWSSKRAGYVRLRDGSRIMALQFEAIVRNKQQELTNITSYEARLLAIGISQDITPADYKMFQEDMKEQLADENSTRRYLTVFSLLANGSRKNYEHYVALIDAGDNPKKKK